VFVLEDVLYLHFVGFQAIVQLSEESFHVIRTVINAGERNMASYIFCTCTP
jgi:hypothetical protein